MQILTLFEYIVLCGVGYGGLSTFLVLGQTFLSSAMEVRFLFAAMKKRSVIVKVMSSMIPMVLALTYLIITSIAFTPFLAGAWDEYNYGLLADLTLNVPCVLEMMAAVGVFLLLTVLYSKFYSMKPLEWLITFGVEAVAAISLLVLYGGLFLRSFPFTIFDLCRWDVTLVRWPVYGLFTIVFKDFVLAVSLFLGALLRERRPRREPDMDDVRAWQLRYEIQVQRYLTQDYLAVGVGLLSFGLAAGSFFSVILAGEDLSAPDGEEIAGMVIMIGLIALMFLGFCGVGLLLIYRRLRPATAKIYRQLLSLGDHDTVLRLFYQEMIAETPVVRKVQFNSTVTTTRHFKVTRWGMRTTVERIAPLDR